MTAAPIWAQGLLPGSDIRRPIVIRYVEGFTSTFLMLVYFIAKHEGGNAFLSAYLDGLDYIFKIDVRIMVASLFVFTFTYGCMLQV